LRRLGIGSRVLAMAEEEGRRRGSTRIALTTLSIEAPGFYQKQGYDIAATIDCDPDNQLGDAGVVKGDGSQFRSGLAAGGSWIRTIGPA
jgi:ribosomal protein S18 acetylase RimI-like enzyme